MTSERNPFPSSGVARPGFEVDVQIALPSQGGALERIEELCRSVMTHGTTTTSDEFGNSVLKGKPELVFLRGEFGSGKTQTLTSFYNDCRKGRIKIKEGSSVRKGVVLALYQTVHAMLSNPMDFLEVMINGLREAATGEIKQAVDNAIREADKTNPEKDELTRKIFVWRSAANAAVTNGADALAIILDELEESVTDYTKYVDGYARLFSIIREFTDRQIGPVITLLGVTPKAIDSLVEETKEALLRRAVTIDLPHLTSSDEFIELAKGYDVNAKKYVDADAFDVIYGLTKGNPGFALAALHWAWEEMSFRNVRRIDPQLATEAVDSIAWKGERLRKTAIGLEVEARYPSARRALDVAKREAPEEITPENVLEGVAASLDSVASIKHPDQAFQSLQKEFEQRGVQLKAASVISASIYSEPNVEFYILLAYADDECADEKNIADVLNVWAELNGDLILIVIPIGARVLRRQLDKLATSSKYRGIEWRQVIITLPLGQEDGREFTGLTRMAGSAAEIKTAERLIAEKFGLSARIEEIIRELRNEGKTIPYRWELKGLTKEIQWGIYSLVAKRFTEQEFSTKDAIDFVKAHYDLVEETKTHYAEAQTGKYSDANDFLDKVTRDVVGVLDSLVDQGFATKRGSDKFYIPSVTPYDRELYGTVKAIREKEKGRNPGTDELKNLFFGYSPKGNSIYAIAKGMEGKGYMQCIQEGPRRFYRSLDPDEHLAEAEIAVKRAEKRIDELLSQRLRDSKVKMKEEDIKHFAKTVAASVEKQVVEAERLIDQAGKKGGDSFARLRLMSQAEVLALMEADYAIAYVDRWLNVRSELSQASAEIGRYDAITVNAEDGKRLTKAKAAEIKGLIEQAHELLGDAQKKLEAFKAEEVAGALPQIYNKTDDVEKALLAELEQFGKAEKTLRVARESLEEITEFINRNKKVAIQLKLPPHVEKLVSGIDASAKALEKGQIVDITCDPLPLFLRKTLGDRVPFVKRQLVSLKQAEELLNALGQSPAADQLVSSIKQIERYLERAERNEASRDYDGFVENLATALSELESQEKMFDRLRTLLMGATRGNKPRFKTMGVDGVIAEELHTDKTRARQLRHLLENQDLVKCVDIEV